MKICIPVGEYKGLDSLAYGHFGSAPVFCVYDTDTKEVSKIQNGDLDHEHGKCQPIQAIQGQKIDAVLVGGIGRGALVKLNAEGIKVYRAHEVSVKENIELFNNGSLEEISGNNTCTHHDCGNH